MCAGKSETIYSLQILRFIAAFIVILDHVGIRMGDQARRYGFELHIVDVLGSFGVRIFFVISGFIMVWICFSKGVERAPSSGKFFLERVRRIVPMYWLCSTVYLVFCFWSASRGDDVGIAKLDVAYVLKSYFFIPTLWINGEHRPLWDVGWTLNFEMFFYAIFAIGLLVRGFWGVATVAVALASSVFLTNPQSWLLQQWTDPIVLYFVVGMGLGAIRIYFLDHGLRLPEVPGALPVAGITALWAACVPQFDWNIVFATLPVAICVFTANRQPETWVGRLLVDMGNASYSTYLVHGFVLLVFGMIWRKIFGGDHIWTFGALEVTLSLLCGWLTWRYIEKRLGRMFSGPRRALQPA